MRFRPRYSAETCPYSHSAPAPNVNTWTCDGCGASCVDMQDWPVHTEMGPADSRVGERVTRSMTPEALRIAVEGMRGESPTS